MPNSPAYGATVPKNWVLVVTGIAPPSAENIKFLFTGDLEILSSWKTITCVSSANNLCTEPSWGSKDIVRPPSDSLNWFM